MLSSQLSPNWLALAAFVITVVTLVVKRTRSRTTKLRGPPRGDFFFGQANNLLSAESDAAIILEGWAEQYGSVYTQPGPFGMNIINLMDPKAIAHFYASGETTYVSMPFVRRLLGEMIGHGIISAEGDDHKRQRRAMTAAFTNQKMREYTVHFLETVHKVKSAWDQKLENSDSIELNVTPWMNAISLDSMGAAGFAHDFGATRGKKSAVGDAFAAFGNLHMSVASVLVFLLQPKLPILQAIPTERKRMNAEIKAACGALAQRLLQDTKDAQAKGDSADEKSVLGLLLKAQSANTGFPMDQEEVNSLMRTLMLAGYETTSVSMTWALVELAKRPDIQDKLRAELRAHFPSSDPTWDQLTQELPMLDAVVHETLRLHPAATDTNRQASKDDVIPLSQPLLLPDGTMTDKIFVEAGANVGVPIAAVNLMRSLWGDDAHEFKPERWLKGEEGLPAGAKELQGHRHLLTFINGPRTCLGKGFALAEFKAAFSVLLRHYMFEFPRGPDTQIRTSIAVVPRPTVAHEPRCHVTMRITRIE